MATRTVNFHKPVLPSCADLMQISSLFEQYRLCRRWDCALYNSFALPLRVGYPLGDSGSSFLSQPAEWWEPGTGQPKMVCYFYHSVLDLRAAPWRPVAGSSPQAAEFNPRTALPRGDGKHLASCLTTRLGCPASVLLTPKRVFSTGRHLVDLADSLTGM